MLISVFSVFQIVKFKNEACTTSTGEMGTCYTESECTAAGGTASGTCASSFGTCCLCESLQLAVIGDINKSYFLQSKPPYAEAK